MSKWLKFFPFMPEKGDVGKLILALLFYLIVPSVVGAVIGFILGLTVILLPLAFVVGGVLGAYSLGGTVLAVLCFTGYEFKD